MQMNPQYKLLIAAVNADEVNIFIIRTKKNILNESALLL